MSTHIHPTAVVDPAAELGADVNIGPHAVIEGGTVIGDGTEIKAHAVIMRGARLGTDCQVWPGAVLGGPPQDVNYQGQFTRIEIGSRTILREYVTIHYGTRPGGTAIGSDVYLMAYVHVGHDGRVGDHVILANAVQLGGHVQVGACAMIGGGTPVHQHCRVGTHAMVGGGYRVVQDVPPYILASGEPLRFGGLNVVGLRRRGFPPEVRAQIKKAYRLVYRSGCNLAHAIERIKRDLEPTPEVQTILKFLETSSRGIV